jgi:thiol-disulfide isomerase/thioredoxin
MMKKILILVLIISAVSYTTTIPDFKLKNLDNRRISYSELKGTKFTVIDFWATWCKPCLRAIPKLVEINDEFSDQGIAIIGINVDSPRNTPKIRPYARSMGINYPVLLDINSEVSQELQVTVLPTLMIADTENKIVYVHQGYRPGDEIILREKIIALLKELESNEKD